MTGKYHFRPGMEETLMMTPQMQAAFELPQNNYHLYHVGPHCLRVGRNTSLFTDDVDVIAAAYIHDDGKPVVVQPAQGKSYFGNMFPGHAEAGEHVTLKMDYAIFAKLGLDKKKVARLVGGHYLPMETLKELYVSYGYAQTEEFAESFGRNLSSKLRKRGLKKEEIWPIVISDSREKGIYSNETIQLLNLGQHIFSVGLI